MYTMLSGSVARGGAARVTAWPKLRAACDLSRAVQPVDPLRPERKSSSHSAASHIATQMCSIAPTTTRCLEGTGSPLRPPDKSRPRPWALGDGASPRGFASESKAAPNQYLAKVPGYTAAAKAIQDAREQLQKGKDRLSQTSKTAYGYLPEAARQVIESSSQERSKVAGLHFDAFWQGYGTIATVTAGATGTLVLWKTLLGVGGCFGAIKGTTSMLLLATSATSVFGGLQYARHRYSIDPDAVYRSAMRQMNSHIGVLEAMGPPLVGTEMRAYILTGGGLRLQGLVPKFRSHRLKMVFLLRGADARGLVAIDAKRWKGKTVFNLLAIDIPATNGSNVRIFLHGMPSQFQHGGVFDEMYQPLRTVAAQATKLRAADDAEDDIAIAKAKFLRDAVLPKPLAQGGSMYPWERAVEAFHWYRQKLLSAFR